MARLKIITTAFLIIQAAASPADEPGQKPPAVSPSSMTAGEIRAYNEGLSPGDPNYIRCVKSEVVGSLVRRLRICWTNAQWEKASDIGNQNARDTVEAMTKAPLNTGN